MRRFAFAAPGAILAPMARTKTNPKRTNGASLPDKPNSKAAVGAVSKMTDDEHASWRAAMTKVQQAAHQHSMAVREATAVRHQAQQAAQLAQQHEARAAQLAKDVEEAEIAVRLMTIGMIRERGLPTGDGHHYVVDEDKGEIRQSEPAN